jgi:hypothetical protein
MGEHLKTPRLEIRFVFRRQGNLLFLKTCCNIYVLFSQNSVCHNFTFSCSKLLMFFISSAVKYKYQPAYLKVVVLKKAVWKCKTVAEPIYRHVLQVVLVSNPYSQRVTESNISRWRKTAR